MRGFTLYFLKDLRQRNRPIIVLQRSEKHVHMVWHHNQAMDRAFCSVQMKTSLQDNFTRCRRKMPAMMGRERREDRLLVSLIVGESAAVVILPEHGLTIKPTVPSVLCRWNIEFVMNG
jgi:hypothetical protein